MGGGEGQGCFLQGHDSDDMVEGGTGGALGGHWGAHGRREKAALREIYDAHYEAASRDIHQGGNKGKFINDSRLHISIYVHGLPN